MLPLYLEGEGEGEGVCPLFTHTSFSPPSLFVSERTCDLLVNTAVHNAWVKKKTRITTMAKDEHLIDQKQARQVFDQLDENKNETLNSDENRSSI